MFFCVGFVGMGRFCLMGLVYYFILLSNAYASMFGCEIPSMQDHQRPEWVAEGWRKPGYYIGIGRTEERKSSEEWLKSSETSAIDQLARSISISIESDYREEMQNSSKGFKDAFEQSIKTVVQASIKENLRGVEIAGKWLDGKNCVLWTLAIISEEKVEANRRFQKLGFLFDAAQTQKTAKNKKLAIAYLADANALLDGLNFKLIPESGGKDLWLSKLDREMKLLKGDVEYNTNKTMVAPLLLSDDVGDELVNKIIGAMRGRISNGERLLGSCRKEEECMDIAAGQGFGNLLLVKIGKEVSQSMTGAYKATVRVEITLYDTGKRAVKKGPYSDFSQVVGWAADSLDWNLAADKVLQSEQMNAVK